MMRPLDVSQLAMTKPTHPLKWYWMLLCIGTAYNAALPTSSISQRDSPRAREKQMCLHCMSEDWTLAFIITFWL